LKKSAFTLIEIVVSLGILALGILAIFSLIPMGVDQAKKAHDQSKAIILAQSKMEEIISIASEEWEKFYSYNHYYYPKGNDPMFMGPNTPEEKTIWGWENTVADTWVPKLGYQWEWHFIEYLPVSPPHLPPDAVLPPGNLALITLTVSWPQEWSEVDDGSKEQIAIKNINNINDSDPDHVTKKNIQFVRLISYVSKGL